MRREWGIGSGESMAAHLILPTSNGTPAGRYPKNAPAFAFAFSSALAPAFAFAVAVASLRLKASRAPQPDAAEEAPLSERSELGRRAASGEERRAPMRLHRIGECPAQTVLLAASRSPYGPASPFAPRGGAVATFAKTKVARASARKLLLLLSPLPLLVPSAPESTSAFD